VCNTHTPVPASGLITDFSEFTSGTTWSTGATKAWGGNSILAGNASFYGVTGVTLTALITTGGQVELKVSLPTGNYVGFALTMGVCADASAFSGISAVIGGTLNNATLGWQLETSNDTPMDTSTGRGKCAYTSTSPWNDCGYNSVTVSGVAATAATFKYSWSQFTGGKPVTTVDTNELLGLQWQFECKVGGGCSIDITIDDVKFY
jgi:hypothetical protein